MVAGDASWLGDEVPYLASATTLGRSSRSWVRLGPVDEGKVRAAKRRVLWLMIPVAIVAVILATITVFLIWVVTHPGSAGP